MHTLYDTIRKVLWPKFPFLYCLFVWSGIMMAGLWPLHRPRNEVAWVHDGPGLLLEGYNIILSSGIFDSSASSCSIELLLTPGITHDSSTVLAFFTPDRPLQFLVRQHDDSVVIASDIGEKKQKSTLKQEDVFQEGKRVFLAATISDTKTAVYVDGKLMRTFAPLPLAGRSCSGQLLLGNSPDRVDSWFGRLAGVAIYSKELPQEDVVAHYKSWLEEHRPQILHKEDIVALFLMNEAKGNVIHSEIGSGKDLYIPERYRLPRQPFLEPVWSEYAPSLNYWISIGLNIAAFVPLGWFGYGYLPTGIHKNSALLMTVFCGTATSLTIEVLQAYLPTRHSGVTDIFTNSLGTLVGVLLWRRLTPKAAPEIWGQRSQRWSP